MQAGKIVDIDAPPALSTAELLIKLKPPVAESLILASARAHNATLWTQDEHLIDIEGAQYVEKK
jgi:predicted nucleic acid-binding protein